MKKVLAIVLAVVMVCTMALAVEINLTPGEGATGSTTTDSVAVITNIKPGETVTLVLKDKDGKTVTPYLKDGKTFVPASNVVTVTFAKGAEYVQSQGWVKLKGATTEDMSAYEYQIKFKSDLSKVADPKVAEIVISGVTFKATGYNTETLLKATKNSEMLGYSYGYTKTPLTLTEGTDAYAGFNPVAGTVNVVDSITNKKGEPVSAAEVEAKTGNYTLTYSLTKGMKFFTYDKTIEFTEKDTGFKPTTTTAADITNLNNIAGKAVVALGNNAGTNYKVYAKTSDGKVLSVAATNNDGVLSFTVPAMSRVIVTTDTLTVSGSTGTTTGTTTNPGTGANDVVGVAAALAVVALVSGAAISLKK